jgi:hypothetical protein
MNMHDDRSDLTPDERDVVGMPGDLVSEEPVSARPRSTSVMLSLRIDRQTFDELSRLADGGGRTFSETAREALRTFVREHGGGRSYPIRASEWTRAGKRVSEDRQVAWNDDDLRSALERYETASRQAGMREKAWRSYVDYARRFLAWRTGDYQPRGLPAGDRPVPQTAVSSTDLRQQAEEYARQVEAAGRQQPTVDTYFRHALFFIRWLEGDFRPGGRLQGLR